jgi:AraC family transcriptional activator FtrA
MLNKLLMRFVLYVSVFVLLVGGAGAIGLARSKSDFYGAVRLEPIPALNSPIGKPIHDAEKPTAAVLIGNERTEGLDFAIPYQMFSMTGAYNVYAVAADTQLKSLTGGLDVIPHYSFLELESLLGRSPDIIVIPYMTTENEAAFKPVRDFLRKHADTTLLSICGGSGNLAAAGLLDGITAASHWQTIGQLSKAYPEVNWVRDQRYTAAGNRVTTAGVSSGIDGMLYVISQRQGEKVAQAVAKQLNYPSYHYVSNPNMEPFAMDIRFAVYLLNNAFQWNKQAAGVLLYNGVEEMALASVFDIYSDTGTTRVKSVAGTDQPVLTKYGLELLPRYTVANAPKLDKRIVPGAKAKELAAPDIARWNERAEGGPLQFVHSDSPDRFLFEVQLEDLAKQEDVLTAKHAVKRLEYRANEVELKGKPFSMETYGVMALAALLAVLASSWIDRRYLLSKFNSRKDVRHT